MRFLFGRLSLLIATVYLLGFGCTPIYQPEVEIEGVKPLWGTKLPGKAGIYNEGMIGLPIYNGRILFHSTYSLSLENEDNRIHALNMESGEIIWTFPVAKQNDKRFNFSGVPYQFDEYLVTKMRKYALVLTDRLVCINSETGQEVWYKEIPAHQSYNTNNDVVGENADFYYFHQSESTASLSKGNVLSGVTTSILTISPEPGFNYNQITSNIVFHKNKRLLVAGAWERDLENDDLYSYKNYLYIINLETNSVEKVFVDRNENNEMLIARIYGIEDNVFVSFGLSTICYNLNTQSIIWCYNSNESYNDMTNRIVVNDDIVFLYGDNRFVGLDAKTGQKLYQGNIQCANANAFNGYAYVIARDAKLYILDIKTGKTLHRIICPEEYTIHTGFLTSCKPKVYGDKLYVFGNYHAYCYEAAPTSTN